MSDLINDPTEAGFVWELGQVSYEVGPKDRRPLGLAPYPRVLPDGVMKFEQTFPGLIAAALNGQSLKVRSQAATRRALLAARQPGGVKPTETQLRELVLRAMRGVRMSVRQVVYKDLSGNVHETELAAQQANIAILVDLGVPADVARAKVSGMAAETVESTEDAEE